MAGPLHSGSEQTKRRRRNVAKALIAVFVTVVGYLSGVVFNLIRGGIQARRFAKPGYSIPDWHMICVVQTSWLSWLLPLLELVAHKGTKRGTRSRREWYGYCQACSRQVGPYPSRWPVAVLAGVHNLLNHGRRVMRIRQRPGN